MSLLRLHILIVLILQSSIFIGLGVRCDDEETNLLQGINSYRASLNLTTLKENTNAACFAAKLADQFQNRPCTNSTGSNTIPGTESPLSNYMNLLAKCRLNFTSTRDGAVMPACVPHLNPLLVLSNFTKSQYSMNLNESEFVEAGIGSKKDWIVVVLATNTPEGSFSVTEQSAGNVVSDHGLILKSLLMLFGYWVLPL